MGLYYWPPAVERRYTLAAYEKAFTALGYAKCETEAFAGDLAKVALFAKGTDPKHASRQLNGSAWTSKLGQSVDISHELHALAGECYGNVVTLLARPSKKATG